MAGTRVAGATLIRVVADSAEEEDSVDSAEVAAAPSAEVARAEAGKYCYIWVIPMARTWIISLLLLLCMAVNAQIENTAQEVSIEQDSIIEQVSTLKLVFTGDIMGHDTQIASALVTGDSGYDYKPCFLYLEPYLY